MPINTISQKNQQIKIQTDTEESFLQAAVMLHRYIMDKHWEDGAIVGPDPIGKINWRITRFLKSYSQWLPWSNKLVYMQGQSYWILGNIDLSKFHGESTYLDIVYQSAQYIIENQHPNGAWEHPPIRGRQGFISAVETVWACLGLISAYKVLDKKNLLHAALNGYDAIIKTIGFQFALDSLAVNYYAHSSEKVPNVTTMLLWLMAEIYDVTRDEKYLEHTQKMIRFIEYSQMKNGELQYVYSLRPHFQCYQYNSFQFLDLANYYAITHSERIRKILIGIAHYLSSGITEQGSCRYSCFKEYPDVIYWTAAIAAALLRASQFGIGEYEDLSDRAYRRVLSRQNSDGGFNFSEKNYHFLADKSSYPRQQSMILEFLLMKARDSTKAI